MRHEAAHIIVELLTIYGVAGALVAAAFLLFGLDRIDPAAHGAYAFRRAARPWPRDALASRRAALVRAPARLKRMRSKPAPLKSAAA